MKILLSVDWSGNLPDLYLTLDNNDMVTNYEVHEVETEEE